MNAFGLLSALPLALLGFADVQGQPPAVAAVPIEPVSAIIKALESYQVVGLGTGAHNNEQGHALVLALIGDRRFPAAGADLVVECGNAHYQDVMNRFITDEDVPHEALRHTWEDTTQPHAGCDTPIHEELFQTVRVINSALADDRRIRVFLGDPPIDWDSPTAKQDRDTFMFMRDSYPAQLIQREILARGRRALVVYGQGHLQRKQILSNYDMSHPLAHTIISLLESDGAKVFTIWGNTRADLEPLQRNIAAWARPSLALVRGTVLGAADFQFFFSEMSNRLAVKDGTLAPIPRDEWLALRMEDQFDALLYLGPPSSITTAQSPISLCADAAYMKKRLGRLEEYGPKAEADRIRQRCAESLK
jgi:hypothetical protein